MHGQSSDAQLPCDTWDTIIPQFLTVEGIAHGVLNPRTPGIVGGERGRLLPLPCGLDGLVLGLRPHGELARRMFSRVHAWRTGHARQVEAWKRMRTTGSPETSRPGVHLMLVYPWGQRAWARLPVDQERA
jgi:hypothetical protein